MFTFQRPVTARYQIPPLWCHKIVELCIIEPASISFVPPGCPVFFCVQRWRRLLVKVSMRSHIAKQSFLSSPLPQCILVCLETKLLQIGTRGGWTVTADERNGRPLSSYAWKEPFIRLCLKSNIELHQINLVQRTRNNSKATDDTTDFSGGMNPGVGPSMGHYINPPNESSLQLPVLKLLSSSSPHVPPKIMGESEKKKNSWRKNINRLLNAPSGWLTRGCFRKWSWCTRRFERNVHRNACWTEEPIRSESIRWRGSLGWLSKYPKTASLTILHFYTHVGIEMSEPP